MSLDIGGREMTRQIEIQALVHEEDGSFWGEVPGCPGLFASGRTLDELVEGLREAWALYHDGDPGPDENDSSAGRGVSGASSLTLKVPAFG